MDAEPSHQLQRSQSISLGDLPTEILDHICASLCLHCQLPQITDIEPDAVSTAIDGQAALACLSRCSSQLRASAQPVLFHFYHTGRPRYVNVIPDPRTRIPPERRAYKSAVSQLSAFTRTITQRPDLRFHVRALILYTRISYRWTIKNKDPAYDLFEFCKNLADQRWSEASQLISGGYLAEQVSRPGSLELMQELTIALCGETLEDLLLERYIEPEPFYCGYDETSWESWDYALPRLRRLGFPGDYGTAGKIYHVKQARGFVRQAPNLNVLIAPDCSGSVQPNWSGDIPHHLCMEPWGDDVPLRNLTKLSVSGLGINELVEILAHCPALEDLEYYYEDDGWSVTFEMATHLEAVKSTLRRLCHSSIRPQVASPHYSLPYWALAPEKKSLSAFPRLEELEIERFNLYSGAPEEDSGDESTAEAQGSMQDSGEDGHAASKAGSDRNEDQTREEQSEGPDSGRDWEEEWIMYRKTTPEGFLSKLPPAIRTLRIGFIQFWPSMYRDALALATQAPERFPRLREVILAVETPAPEDEVGDLVSLFSSAGIAASVRPANMYYGQLNRGLLPPRPGLTEEETLYPWQTVHGALI